MTEQLEEDRVWFTPDNLFRKYATREEAQEAADKINAALQVKTKAYVRKWLTTADIDISNDHNFTEEEKQEVADYINEHGYRDPMDPTPALVRYFGEQYKGYYYFADENHSGHLWVTEAGAKKHNFEPDERLDEIWDEEEVAEFNEDRPKDNPWVYSVYIVQYWSVYDSNGIEIDSDHWKDLPPDCEPYEDEFVLGINGIPESLIDDEENCEVQGWCDG